MKINWNLWGGVLQKKSLSWGGGGVVRIFSGLHIGLDVAY